MLDDEIVEKVCGLPDDCLMGFFPDILEYFWPLA
jgi:hypothetical protein